MKLLTIVEADGEKSLAKYEPQALGWNRTRVPPANATYRAGLQPSRGPFGKAAPRSRTYTLQSNRLYTADHRTQGNLNDV